MVKTQVMMKEGHHLYAVAMLIKKGDLFLGVSRRDDFTDFGLPGGKIDDGESPIESIMREMKEECGVELDKRILDNCFVFERSEKGKVCRTYVYTGPEMEVEEGIHEENGGWCKWVTREDLENGCFGIYNTALFKCFQDYYYDDSKPERRISVTKKELNAFLHDVDMGSENGTKSSYRLYKFMGWDK